MANFEKALDEVLVSEGGYTLTDDPVDRGGRTYAGIAQNRNPHWPGWAMLDDGVSKAGLVAAVRKFYHDEFWAPLRCEHIDDQDIAHSIFSTGVLQGVGTAARLTQMAVEVPVDGHMGPVTVGAVNAIPKPRYFLDAVGLSKVARFLAIGERDRGQWNEYGFGWCVRAVREARS